MDQFFRYLVESDLNTSDALQNDCLWLCFAELLQEDLDSVTEHWNTHCVIKSRHDTIAGVPDALIICQREEVGSQVY